MEGSSWDATVVEDIVYLGDVDSFHDEQMRDQFGTHFMFGCQNHETGNEVSVAGGCQIVVLYQPLTTTASADVTGLFISQVADGIMGLSNNGAYACLIKLP